MRRSVPLACLLVLAPVACRPGGAAPAGEAIPRSRPCIRGGAAPVAAQVAPADTVQGDLGRTPEELRPIRLPGPRCPEHLRRVGQAGEVRLDFVIDTAGRVEAGSVHVAWSTDRALTRAVCDALTEWRFKPVVRGGRAVRVAVVGVTFHFSTY